MILSGGELVLADTSPSFGRVQYFPLTGVALSQQFASYAAIYRKQLWVNIVVDKLALGTARLPLKVYERDANGDRREARDSDYGRLMREPNPKHDKFFFWLWTASTKEVYGEALWVKIRDAAGIPRELWPLHPVNVYTENERTEGGEDELAYYVTQGPATVARLRIPERDIVHFKTYNPDTTARGMSKIEPLRQTLLNEDAARRATSAFWSSGARPAVALKSKLKLSPAAKASLKQSWNAVTAGADNTGATVVLEEGMEAERLSLTAEEAQYIETRKLNREEVCGAYDIPPPVVHILDRATFSNITEQMRSMYRDTQAPRLGSYESVLDKHLRPDFKTDTQYAEFLLEEVLRGDFEARADAQQKAVNSGQRTPNEMRALDNLPPMPGGDKLYINTALVPLEQNTDDPKQQAAFAADVGMAVQRLGLGVNYNVLSADEARTFLPGVTGPAPDPTPPAAEPPGARSLDRKVAAKVADRASRAATLADVDADQLTAGLNGSSAAVRALLDQSRTAGDDVPTFCALVWALAGGTR